MKQLVFSLNATHGVAGAEDVLPTTGNAAARGALQQLSPTGHPNQLAGLVLVGAEGTGKTHLARAWLAAWQEGGLAAVLDNLEALTEAQQEGAFHTFNRLKEKGGALLVCSRAPVASLPLLPDLSSRLATLQHVYIQPPDDAELRQFLITWAAQRQIVLPPAVVEYVLARAERSPKALFGLIQSLDTLSLEQKRAITVPLARQVLGG